MDRDQAVKEWLADSDWRDWERVPMTGDASARRYERLRLDEKSLILMDAPPETCGSQASFVKVGSHLRSIGLCAPRVYEWDEQQGLIILEDLGGTDFSEHLSQHPNDDAKLYQDAMAVLVELRSAPAPTGLIKMTPEVGANMIGLAFDWAASDKSTGLALETTTLMKGLLESIDNQSSVLSLRDFHAENLIWRPNEKGVRRVGLLDFQDAFISHPMYDVASLVRDARRDVRPGILDLLVPDEQDRRAFHILALQRNLRILGIFHKLAKQDGKTRYLDYIPRVWGHIQEDLTAPETEAIAPLVRRAFEGSQ